MPNLTAKSVENAKAGTERREIADGLLRGFYLIVQPSGAKSFAVRYRSPIDGRTRKHTIGGCPPFELGKAREAGAAALRAVAEGRDPATEKRDTRARAHEGAGADDSIESVFKQFVDRYAKVHTRETSWRETQRIFDKEIEPRWGGRKVQGIAKRDVLDLLDAIVDNGAPVVANRTLAAIRRFFNWCIERDILTASPCAGVKPPAAEAGRERVLSDGELSALLAVCDQAKYPFGPLVKLLILTGQRIGEVSELPWSEVDLDAKIWHLPGERAKNHRASDVPLSNAAVSVLKSMPRVKGKAGLVFTTTGETPVSGMTKAKRRIDEELLAVMRKRDRKIKDIPHWTFHDIRRTVATNLQKLRFPVEVVEAVLNHKSGKVKGVAAIYSRHDYADEKRKALNAWARFITDLVEGRTASNVVRLAGRAS